MNPKKSLFIKKYNEEGFYYIVKNGDAVTDTQITGHASPKWMKPESAGVGYNREIKMIFSSWIFNEKISRASGFSLLELMVVVAMLGGVSMVVMNITKQSRNSTAKLEFDSDITLTTNEINAILSDPVKCLAALGTDS